MEFSFPVFVPDRSWFGCSILIFYILVFRSKTSEMEWVVKRSSRNQPQSGEAVLRLRGLPFGCSKEEIAQFFSGKKRTT